MASFNDQIFASLNTAHDGAATQQVNSQEGVIPLSTPEKRKIIFRNINKLTPVMKLDIVAVVVTRGMGSLIKSCSEGVVIDLNNLDPDTINQMYYMLDYKLNNI